MRILVAEDDQTTRIVIVSILERVFHHEVIQAGDGGEAWEILRRPDAPRLAILDWMMPVLEGPEICRRVRRLPNVLPPYIIMVTGRDAKADITQALDAGADEYLTKPIDFTELRARVDVGRRIIDLQTSLAEHVYRLQEALGQVRTLQGIIPICQHCHKIRTDRESWEGLDLYVATHTDATFSHGICPDCVRDVALPEMRRLSESLGQEPP